MMASRSLCLNTSLFLCKVFVACLCVQGMIFLSAGVCMYDDFALLLDGCYKGLSFYVVIFG